MKTKLKFLKNIAKSTVGFAILCLLAVCLLTTLVYAETVERWGIFEIVLKGPESGNPFLDVELSAMFKQGNRFFEPDGFYDGDGVYRVRFMPDTPGVWKYVTKSNRKELNGKTGEFTCVEPSPGNHGPVGVRNTYHFGYADGTPYFQFGTTCYAWIHQGNKREEQTLATLRDAPFNKIRMCIFPKDYVYNKNEPVYYPFEGTPLKNWDFTRFNPEFFQHLENRVGDLLELGIEADIILFHPYDRWGYANMDAETDDRYLRYVVARLAAYRNVWWSMANEFDFMRNKKMADWDRFFNIVKDNDPYQHLRGIHNGSQWYDHTKSWVTHASLQTSDMAGGIRFRLQYQKPVIYDECQYEGDIPQGWGNITALQMVRRFWLGTIAGCYVGHGETYKHPDNILWWSKGGVLHGQSPKRISFLKEFIASAPPFEKLEPIGDDKGSFILAKQGEYYLVYFVNSQNITLDLAGNQLYKIDGIDPWEMKEMPIGTARSGQYTFSSPRSDYVYRLTPYTYGERLRPEARALADVTLGSAPLDVKFSAAGNLKHHWDFGDGNTSDETNPTHVYKRFSRYIATLTVTDKEGISSTTSLSIVVIPSSPGDLGKYKNWPGSNSGLVFLWSNDRESNLIVDDEGRTVRVCAIEPRGNAEIGSAGEMQIGQGAFLAKSVNDHLLKACKLSNQLTVEVVITTSSLKQGGPARIITFSRDTGNRNFTLGQDGDNLVLRLRTPSTGSNGLNPQVYFGEIKVGEPTHVIVSYFPGYVYCYINGKLTYSGTEIQGDFINWEPCHLLFGDEYSGGRNWQGKLKGVAIYNRFVSPKEAVQKYNLYKTKKQ